MGQKLRQTQKQNKRETGILAGMATACRILKALQDGGASDKDLCRLLSNNALVQSVVDMFHVHDTDNAPSPRPKFPSEIFAPDLIPTFWAVVEDIPPSTFKVSKLKWILLLRRGEYNIKGDTLYKRATKFKGNLGLVDGQYILDHQDQIPVEMQDKPIILPGTILRDSIRELYIPYLYFFGSRWHLCFSGVRFGWDGTARFACIG